ncbi:unnamed protein product, partial [marine sediment metagenome]
GTVTPGADQIAIELWFLISTAITSGKFYYGTSKTALINSKAATVAADKLSATITGLTTGVKYYIQFRPTLPATDALIHSGIY